MNEQEQWAEKVSMLFVRNPESKAMRQKLRLRLEKSSADLDKLSEWGLDINPQNRTISAYGGFQIEISCPIVPWFKNFLRGHPDIFGHLPSIEGSTARNKLKLTSQIDAPSRNQEVRFEHYIDGIPVYYSLNPRGLMGLSRNALSVFNEIGRTYVGSFYLRCVPIPETTELVRPEFLSVKEVLCKAKPSTLIGDYEGYDSVKQEDIVLYSLERGHELGQEHIIQLDKGEDGPCATLFLNRDGLVSLRQRIKA